MLDKQSKIALILPTPPEVDLFMMGCGALNARNVTSFTSAKEAYEVAVRQQFDFFVTRMEMPDMTGIVLVQKLRETGNYGHEVHLFVSEKLDPRILNVLFELDINYVLVKPLDKKLVAAKIAHVFQTEARLPDFERRFREARAAFQGNLLDMAEELARALYQEQPNAEKVLILLGDIAAKQEKPQEMLVHYANAMKVNPKSAVAAHKLAHAYMKKGENARAAQLLNSLAHLNPYNIKLLENAGLSNLHANDLDKAQEYASKLKGLDDGNRTAGEVTAQVKIAKGDFSDLAGSLKGTHDDKEIVAFLNNAGVKLAQGSDVEGALRMYKSCIDQLQGSKYLHAVHFNMGIAYKKLDDWANAAKAYAAAVRLKPDFEKAAASLAECQRKLEAKKAG
jgi:tetratricopeptide (TPR) repeat protein